MARYRVMRQSLIRGRVYERGEEVEYDGHPADNLEPLDAAGEQAAAKAREHFAAQRAAAQLQANPEAAAMAAATVNEFERRARGAATVGSGHEANIMPAASTDDERTARGSRSKS